MNGARLRRCLIIVAKAPVAGNVKTRLAAGIGAERALALYRCFLEDTIALAEQLSDCRLAISFWPSEAATVFGILAPNALLLPQQGADFGGRLLSAFNQASAHGFDEIVLIGSDNPGLPRAYLDCAFALLRDAPAVLGPARDGGYYLIGMRKPQPALFHSGIAWSTAAVAMQTRVAAEAAHLPLYETPGWYDIDTAADLARLYADLLTAREGAWAPATLRCLDGFAADGLAELFRSVEVGGIT